MQKKIRLTMSFILLAIFMGVVGYSFVVYSHPKKEVKIASAVLPASLKNVPITTIEKTEGKSYNPSSDLLRSISPTVTLAVGNAGQSAVILPTSSSNTSSSSSNNTNSSSDNSSNDTTPTPTITPTPTEEPTVTPSPTSTPTPTQTTPTPTISITPTTTPTLTLAPTSGVTPTIAPTAEPSPTNEPQPTPTGILQQIIGLLP